MSYIAIDQVYQLVQVREYLAHVRLQGLGRKTTAPFATTHSVKPLVAGRDEGRAWVKNIVELGLDTLTARAVGSLVYIGMEDSNF